MILNDCGVVTVESPVLAGHCGMYMMDDGAVSKGYSVLSYSGNFMKG